MKYRKYIVALLTVLGVLSFHVISFYTTRFLVVSGDCSEFIANYESRIAAIESEEGHAEEDSTGFMYEEAFYEIEHPTVFDNVAALLQFEVSLMQRDMLWQKNVDDGDDSYRAKVEKSTQERVDFYAKEYSNPVVSNSMFTMSYYAKRFQSYTASDDKMGLALTMITDGVLSESTRFYAKGYSAEKNTKWVAFAIVYWILFIPVFLICYYEEYRRSVNEKSTRKFCTNISTASSTRGGAGGSNKENKGKHRHGN